MYNKSDYSYGDPNYYYFKLRAKKARLSIILDRCNGWTREESLMKKFNIFRSCKDVCSIQSWKNHHVHIDQLNSETYS